MGSDTAYACSCGTLATVEERVQSSDVVAIGTVTALYEERITFDSKSGEGELVDTDGIVRVSTYYKGTGPAEIPVNDPISTGGCGFLSTDSVGSEAVLFLDLSSGGYVTHICAGSGLISWDEDFRAETIAAIEVVTGPGQFPDAPPQEEPAEQTKDTPWAVILPLAFAIPLAVLVVPAFLHRRGGGH